MYINGAALPVLCRGVCVWMLNSHAGDTESQSLGPLAQALHLLSETFLAALSRRMGPSGEGMALIRRNGVPLAPRRCTSWREHVQRILRSPQPRTTGVCKLPSLSFHGKRALYLLSLEAFFLFCAWVSLAARISLVIRGFSYGYCQGTQADVWF